MQGVYKGVKINTILNLTMTIHIRALIYRFRRSIYRLIHQLYLSVYRGNL